LTGFDFQREKEFFNGVFEENLKLRNHNNTVIAIQPTKIEQLTINKIKNEIKGVTRKVLLRNQN